MTNTDIYALASQASQGRGEEREITPDIYRSSQTLWCLLPGPLLWPLSRLAIVSTSNSCFGDKESPQTTWLLSLFASSLLHWYKNSHHIPPFWAEKAQYTLNIFIHLIILEWKSPKSIRLKKLNILFNHRLDQANNHSLKHMRQYNISKS